MAYESKKLFDGISYITDHETGSWKMGELYGMFDNEKLKDYIKSYGSKNLIYHLAELQKQVLNVQIKTTNDNFKNNTENEI